MYPAIAVQRLMQIPVMIPDKTRREQIVAKVQEGMSLHRESVRLLTQAKKMLEDMVEGEKGVGRK
jgi:hypothetical protein